MSQDIDATEQEGAGPASKAFLDRAAIFGLLTIVFLCARIILFTHGRFELIQLLLKSVNPLSILISSLINNLPIYLLIGAFTFFFLENEVSDKSKVNIEGNTYRFIGYIFLISFGFLVTKDQLITVLEYSFIIAIVAVLRRRNIQFGPIKFLYRVLNGLIDTYKGEKIFYFGIFLIFSSIIPSPSWMPAENIQMSDKDHTRMTAYVVSADPNFTSVILIDKLRALIISTSQIASRQICASEKDQRPFLSGSLKASPAIQCWYKKAGTG
jgi:hypothetical protein